LNTLLKENAERVRRGFFLKGKGFLHYNGKREKKREGNAVFPYCALEKTSKSHFQRHFDLTAILRKKTYEY